MRFLLKLIRPCISIKISVIGIRKNQMVMSDVLLSIKNKSTAFNSALINLFYAKAVCYYSAAFSVMLIIPESVAPAKVTVIASPTFTSPASAFVKVTEVFRSLPTVIFFGAP